MLLQKDGQTPDPQGGSDCAVVSLFPLSRSWHRCPSPRGSADGALLAECAGFAEADRDDDSLSAWAVRRGLGSTLPRSVGGRGGAILTGSDGHVIRSSCGPRLSMPGQGMAAGEGLFQPREGHWGDPVCPAAECMEQKAPQPCSAWKGPVPRRPGAS